MEIRKHFWFLAILLIVSSFYQYFALLDEAPNGWRQSDCASIVYHYYHYNNPLLEPHVLHVLSGDGHSVGECPILYYTAAKICQVIGYHDGVLKFIVLLFWWLSVFWMYMIAFLFSKQWLPSVVSAVYIFSFPLLAHYGMNTMTDIPALSCSIGAFYFYFKANETGKSYYTNTIISVLLFCLAVLFKLHSVLGVVAIFSYSVGGYILPKWFTHAKEKRHPIQLLYILPIMVAKLWNMWALWYNNKYKIEFFGVKIWPGWSLWDASIEDIYKTLYSLKLDAKDIPGFYGLMLVCLVFIFAFIHRNKIPYAGMLWIYLLFNLAFGVYVFVGFRDNDYYFINLLQPLILLICILSMFWKETNKLVLFVVCVLVLININDTRKSVIKHQEKNQAMIDAGFYDGSLLKYIENKGVNAEQRILCTPDYNPNLSLYLLRRKGTTNYAGLDLPDTYKKLEDHHINYAVVFTGEEEKNPVLKEVLTHSALIGQHQTVKLYQFK
ncbi:MAG: hypothetical protein HYZ42_00635 [Bacteroidetes bacterium]|nr:hypothetical protein [Bacteroidota bacterium]